MQMIISSRLLPKTIAFGGQYARQQPCLKSKWRQRVHADISIGSKFEQGDVTGLGEDAEGQDYDEADGMTWVANEQVAIQQSEAEQQDAMRRQLWLRESGQIAQPSGVVDETAPEREAFHRRLVVAAKNGDTEVAEKVILDMAVAGLMPGPRAYHGLVFTYVKAEDAEAALDVLRSAYEAGVQPIAESYTVLIHAFMQQNNIEDAQLVLVSMKRAGLDVRNGWLMLTQALFSKGYTEAATSQLNAGMNEGLEPNASIYEYIIRTCCENGRKEEARGVLDGMNGRGVPPEARHFNPIILAVALEGALEQASDIIYEMASSEAESNLSPNVGSFNALMQGHISQGSIGDYSMKDTMEEVLGMMATYGDVKPDCHTYALLVEGYLKSEELEDAVQSFYKMHPEGGGPSIALPPVVLADFLTAVAVAGLPADLLKILGCLEAEEQQIPEEAMQPVDEENHTFLSAWLVPRYSLLRARVNKPSLGTAAATPAMIIEELEEDDEIRMVEGVLLNQHNFVVDANGIVQSPSKLTVVQMREELAARGLMTEGNRRDIYKRIQAARRSVPPDVVADMKRKQATKTVKSLKLRGANDSARAAEKKERERSTITTTGWYNGQMVKKVEVKQEVSQESEEEDDEIVADDEDDDDEDADRDAEIDDDDDDDDEDDAIVAPKVRESAIDEEDDVMDSRFLVPAAEVDGILGTGVTGNLQLQARDRQEFYSNADAGSDVAVQMLLLLLELKGLPTLADITMIIKVAEAEKSLSAAKRMVKFMDSTDMTAMIFEDGDEAEVAELYRTCARVCYAGNDNEGAEIILQSMQSLRSAIENNRSSKIASDAEELEEFADFEDDEELPEILKNILDQDSLLD